jgi:hypothetical protein
MSRGGTFVALEAHAALASEKEAGDICMSRKE